jgi:hypothetical protein
MQYFGVLRHPFRKYSIKKIKNTDFFSWYLPIVLFSKLPSVMLLRLRFIIQPLNICFTSAKVLEGESFMDLIAAMTKEESGQDVHGWENITLLEEEAVLENKLIA